MNAPARPEFFANVALSVSEYVSSYVTTVLRETSYKYYPENGQYSARPYKRVDSLSTGVSLQSSQSMQQYQSAKSPPYDGVRTIRIAIITSKRPRRCLL